MKVVSGAVAMVVAAGLLTAARPASACSTEGPSPGIGLEATESLEVTEGGVLMVRALVVGVGLEAALQELTRWEVRRGGELQTGEFEVSPLWDGAATSDSDEMHVFALIWRPDAPFTAGGEYTLDYQLARYEEMGHVELTVVPARPAPVPIVVAAPTTVLIEGSEVVCCETPLNSCGDDSRCEPTHGTVLPAIDLTIDLSFPADAHWIVWVAYALPGGEAGPRVQPERAMYRGPDVWKGKVTFDAPAQQYCVVIGLTDARDGSETASQTVCFGEAELEGPVEKDVPLSEAMRPYDPSKSDSGYCMGPLLYEADGAAYPREEAPPAAGGGCSVAPRGGSWALLLLLAVIRRRRARG